MGNEHDGVWVKLRFKGTARLSLHMHFSSNCPDKHLTYFHLYIDMIDVIHFFNDGQLNHFCNDVRLTLPLIHDQ